MVNQGQVRRTEERACFYGGKEEAGRGCFKEFKVVMATHWLSVAVCHWLDGCKEKFFLLPCRVRKVSFFLFGIFVMACESSPFRASRLYF